MKRVLACLLLAGLSGGLLRAQPDPGTLYAWYAGDTSLAVGADNYSVTAWAGGRFTPAQLMNPAICGPDADRDSDGFNNYAEFIAGTDPLNAASRLKLNLSQT